MDRSQSLCYREENAELKCILTKTCFKKPYQTLASKELEVKFL